MNTRNHEPEQNEWRDSKGSNCSGSANEQRRGTNQGTVVDLSHEEVRDVGTADRAEPPVTSCQAILGLSGNES